MNFESSDDPWKELQQKVKFMQTPSTYPGKNPVIKSIETHLSWVFLTGAFAYKLKKPVQFDYLDHSTLEARRRDAQNEVILNQELAPGYYLGTVPLILTPEYEISLGGGDMGGEIIDWIVLMKRFPEQLILNEMINDISVGDPLLLTAARRLTGFYARAEPVRLGTVEYLLRLKRYVKGNREVLSSVRFGLDQALMRSIHDEQLEFLSRNQDLFFERVRKGRIIEGHGDLRPEHICLTDPPLIVDRLEFSSELRTLDPLDELSYLMLECELLGRPEVGEVFLRDYIETMEGSVEFSLLLFYWSYRAILRAKISFWHLDDMRVLNKNKYQLKGVRYLNLAKRILEQNKDILPGGRPGNLQPGPASWPGQREPKSP